ncbi:MAG: class I SAM-dependent methyltransferase [Elusimicrobiota bacterium]|jgi:demethylmenaquinone methyltransferase/2-methoxy-6-polyprenyl-1,4-benzoquinol methylase|nr:class I SAM-dependent methyltransferase [Elusimicrobiota bacterium]
MDKKSTIKFFDDLAQEWDSRENPVFNARISGHIKNASIKKGDIIADVGCGTGILYPYFELAGAASVLCVDISPKMIAELKKKYPLADTLAADFDEAALPLDYFDKVIIFNAFAHFENKEATAAKARKILKSGGGFYIIHSLTRAELAKAHEAKAGLDKDIIPTKIEMREIFTSAGFENILLKEDESGCFFSAKKINQE